MWDLGRRLNSRYSIISGSPSSDDSLFSGSKSKPTATVPTADKGGLFGSVSDDDDMFTTQPVKPAKASDPHAEAAERKTGELFGSPGKSPDEMFSSQAAQKGEFHQSLKDIFTCCHIFIMKPVLRCIKMNALNRKEQGAC